MLDCVQAQNGTAINLTLTNLTDIPQMTSKFVEIVPLIHRQVNGIPFAAIR